MECFISLKQVELLTGVRSKTVDVTRFVLTIVIKKHLANVTKATHWHTTERPALVSDR